MTCIGEGARGPIGVVTLSFKIKTRCSLYICPRSSCHTYGQNVNTENQCLYNINFITRNIVFTRRLDQLSHRAAAENSNLTCNRPGATHAYRRCLCRRTPSHLHLLSSVTARLSRLMVTTQQVKGENIIIYDGSRQNYIFTTESILHVRFVYISKLFTK
jgi:hypothetical protein